MDFMHLFRNNNKEGSSGDSVTADTASFQNRNGLVPPPRGRAAPGQETSSPTQASPSSSRGNDGGPSNPMVLSCTGCGVDVHRLTCTYCIACARALCTRCAAMSIVQGQSKCSKCVGSNAPIRPGPDLPEVPPSSDFEVMIQQAAERTRETQALRQASASTAPAAPLAVTAKQFRSRPAAPPMSRPQPVNTNSASPTSPIGSGSPTLPQQQPVPTPQPSQPQQLPATAAPPQPQPQPQPQQPPTQQQQQRPQAQPQPQPQMPSRSASGDVEFVADRVVNLRSAATDPLRPSNLYTTTEEKLMDGSTITVIVDEAKLQPFGVRLGSVICISGATTNEDDHVATIKGVTVQGRLVCLRVNDPYCTFVPPELVSSLIVLEDLPVSEQAQLANQQALARGGSSSNLASPADGTATAASDWDPRYATLEDMEVLGQGAQGVVWKCRTTDGEIVVRKEMVFPTKDVEIYTTRLNHARRVQQLSHPHLIRYLSVLSKREPLTISIVMPYYTESDLSHLIEQQLQRRRPFDHLKVCSVILQIASSLAYLHSQNPPIAHRDVKPDNILLFENGERTLLMDLDTSKSSNENKNYTAGIGTMEFMAPEVITGQGGLLSDVWSLGTVFLLMVAMLDSPLLNRGGTPTLLCYHEWEKMELITSIKEAIQTANPTTPPPMIGLICSMLVHDLAARPSMQQVCASLETIMESLLITC